MRLDPEAMQPAIGVANTKEAASRGRILIAASIKSGKSMYRPPPRWLIHGSELKHGSRGWRNVRQQIHPGDFPKTGINSQPQLSEVRLML